MTWCSFILTRILFINGSILITSNYIFIFLVIWSPISLSLATCVFARFLQLSPPWSIFIYASKHMVIRLLVISLFVTIWSNQVIWSHRWHSLLSNIFNPHIYMQMVCLTTNNGFVSRFVDISKILQYSSFISPITFFFKCNIC